MEKATSKDNVGWAIEEVGNKNNAAEGNVGWSIDDAASSDEEKDFTPIARTIPRFDEVDWVEESFQRKFNERIGKKQAVNETVEALMEKSVIGPGFEQLHAVPTTLGRRMLQKMRRKERNATKGPGWFNIPVQEVTEEVKNDLDLLKMRSILDPKHVYKKNDLNHTPKYFQVGKVLETAADFYNGRIPKSQRKRTLVDELLADADARAHQKKKYKSIVDTSRRRRKPKSSTGTNETRKKKMKKPGKK